jgi:hypothetical protein
MPAGTDTPAPSGVDGTERVAIERSAKLAGEPRREFGVWKCVAAGVSCGICGVADADTVPSFAAERSPR